MNTNTAAETTEAMQPTQLYSTVKQFSERHPAFSESSLRALIFDGNTNGLTETGAVVRINRKVLINEGRFFDWVDGGNKRKRSAWTKNQWKPFIQSAIDINCFGLRNKSTNG